jgi:DNA polymerase-3 subunit delta'
MTGFKDVVGHRDLIQYIQDAVGQNKVSHAYILNGQRGSGKKMLAKLFAMTLQCESG